MCRNVLGAFRSAGHVSESPHLGTEAAVQFRPLKPWRYSQANTILHWPVRTQQNRRAAALTGSRGIGSLGCVAAPMCVSLPRQWSLTGTAVSQAEAWRELGWGMKGWRIEGWRQAVGDEGITKSWQLLFFLAEFIPMVFWEENVSFFLLLLLTFYYISQHILPISIKY